MSGILTFKSKIDKWLLILMSLAILLPGIFLLFSQESSLTKWVIIAILSASLALVIWVYLTTIYTIDGSILKVRSGPFVWKLEVNQIQKINSTRSILSSPALSFDRIFIECSDSSLIISPQNKQIFIEELQKFNSKIIFTQ